MSERLYYQDPECLSFTARLLAQEPDSGRWRAVLDRTAFYPEGGGHPPDRGTLDGVPVLDVQEIDGEVVHLLGRPLGGRGGGPGGAPEVAGAVDAEHRREYTQQHTGQHIVSASLEAAAGAPTVSAHLGDRYTTVEVDRANLGQGALESAETLANRVVTENLPVRIHWVDREELGRYRLRKPPPPGVERLRIVEIPGHDASPCGGLHVRSTGEVGLIQLVGVEKIRGRLRLSWRIGERAYREVRETERLAQELGRELGCQREELGTAVRQLKERLRGRDQEMARLRRRVAELLASGLRERGRRIGPDGSGGLSLVLGRVDDCDPELLEELFRTLVSSPGTVAALVCPEGDGLRWLAGSSPELDLDLRSVILANLPSIDGRGGGRGNRWQGVGSRPEGAEEFFAAVRLALEQAVSGGPAGNPERKTGEP